MSASETRSNAVTGSVTGRGLAGLGVLVLGIVLLCAIPAVADTATFQQGVSGYAGTVDTYIQYNVTTSNATAVTLNTDGTPPTEHESQILIRFDNIFGSGAGKIPPGATITSATLTVNVTNAYLTNEYVRFNRMLQTWNATDVWATFGASPWNATPGIQADGAEAVAAADVTVNNIPTGSQSITVTTSLQAWLTAPASNFGWVIRSGYADTLAFDSSEATLANRPKLTVNFTAPPPCSVPGDCNDSNVCTDDLCVSNVCQHTNNTASCSDGNPCTTGDVCSGGACTPGTPVSCPPGSTCNPATGICEATPQTVTFQQGTGGYTGAKDTYLHAGSPTADNSAVTTLVVDGPGTVPADERQILMRFDNLFVPEGGPIPNGVQITSATITINVTNESDDGAELHRMIVDWADTATWNSMVGGVQRDNVESVATADTSSLYASTGLHTFSVTTSVAAWAAGATNRGWVWVTPTGGDNSWQFDSAEGATVANRPKLTVTYTMAGPSVTMLAPPNGATGVDANPTLSVSVTDPQGDLLDVTFYGRELGGTVGEDFTVVHVTDTQFYSESSPQGYRTMMQWVNSNQSARNIVHLIHTGDVTNVGSIEQQWINADSAMDLLETPLPGLPYGVPYGILPGNHDGAPDSTLLYNNYFGVSRFLGRPYYGGHYGADNDNNYTLFSGGGMGFIAIQLERWPTTAVLDWADALLKANSDRRAIVGSHYIMEVGENAAMSSEGLAIYDALKDNPNLFLMLCGHMHGEGKRYDDFEGRRVWTLIADYQDVDSGVGGWLRLLRFSPANNKIYVQTYSPTTGNYRTGAESQFELDYAMDGAGPFTSIGALTHVVSGGQANLPWPGRTAGKTYEWYVDVSDGASVTTGPTWSFVSSGACTTPAECEDHNPCTTDACDGGSGVCTHTAVPGCCQVDGDCDDHNLCNGTETCNTLTGSCVAGTPVTCQDGNPCTADACSALTGQCVYTPANEGLGCDDLLDCTINDVCASGVCVGTDDCPGQWVCDPLTNTCTSPTPTLSFQDGVDGYAGTVDTYLQQQAPSTAHGTLDWFEWDSDEGGTGLETLALLRFGDIFGDAFRQIPVGAEILSATVRLYIFDTGNDGSVRPALVAWDETTTYNNFGGEPGAQPDEYGAQVASVGGGGGYQTVDVTASIQTWANAPAGNFGWLIYHTGSAGVGARSREAATVAERPLLTVTFRVQCQTNADCDDGHICTTDTCNGGGECAYVNNTNSCDDGNLCTTSDTCAGGTCAGTSVDCGSGYTCDPSTGNCVAVLAAESLPIEVGDTWRYFKGATAPAADWTALHFDDSGWLSGSSGFGYGTDCTAGRGTLLSDMSGSYVSVYTRRLFHVDDPEVISRLNLTVDYDDAFVAYINGVEVARRNIVGTPPSNTQLATADHECSTCNGTCNPAEVIELSEYIDLLTDNTNILAVQGHNLTSTSSDFTLLVTLTATMAPTCQTNDDCDDDDVCNGAETCQGGSCVAGTPLNCDDGSVCTTDTCDAVNGCAHTPVANGTPCADADLCDGAETCQNGTCTAGTALNCDDGVACTTDSCVPATGCQNINNCPSGQTCNLGTGLCEGAPVDPLPIVYGATWKYFKGLSEPTPGDLTAWRQIGFDDSTWLEGPSGLGFDYYVETGGTNGNGDYGPFIGTELGDMRNCTPTNPPLCNAPGYVSVYMRKAFTVTNAAAVTSLTFKMYADDGYVAYLNGTEVARIRLTGTPPLYNTLASVGPSVAPPVEQTLDLTSVKGLLVTGVNVLAVQGHNVTADSRDLLMIPQLSSTQGCTTDTECNDSNPCTDDACVSTVCQHTNNTASCDDGNRCTTPDACSGGACAGTPVVCNPGATCNPATGLCEFGPQTVTFQEGVAGYVSTQDTYLSETASGATVHGADEDWRFDLDDPSGSGTDNVGLIRFDDIFGSGTGQIPVGSTINSATLRIVVYNGTADAAGTVNECLVEWSEDSNWATFGGDAGVQPDEIGVLVAAAPTAIAPADITVTSSLQAWASNPASNHGWIFRAAGNDGVYVRSSEYMTTPAERPKLTVQYIAGCDNDDDCDDHVFCNGAETCQGGTCLAGTPPSCNDGIACTADSCNETTDACDHVPNDAACNNGVYCDGAETCNTTLGCQAGAAVDCNDGIDCTADFCNETTDVCDHTPNDAACDDGLFCNGAETCHSTTGCQAGTNPCPGQICDEVNDLCRGPQITCDLTAETAPPGASSVAQLFVTDVAALRGYQTTVAITRTSGTGTLTVNCPGGVTINSARPDFVFAGLVAGSDFFSAINCPNRQAAVSRVSGGTPVGSTPAYLAHYTLTVSPEADPGSTFEMAVVPAGSYLVNPTGGSIAYTTGPVCVLTVAGCGSAADCNDDNPCTTDTCEAGNCSNVNNSEPCDDGNACTVGDTCADGSCVPGTSPLDCDDDNECTDDSCVPASGCVNDNNLAACDDGNACTVGDTCADGSCVPGTSPLDCDDDNVCTDDSCVPATGCVHVNNAAACDDNLFCTVSDHCTGGACGGLARDCSASGDQCNDGVCNETASACQRQPKANGTTCNDGLYCNVGETCTAGVCGGGSGDPCPSACQSCNEQTDACVWCRFDVTGDGTIGGGDFGLFAGCFGQCYSAPHTCLAYNFDGGANGCVGGSDFGLFSGCFGGSCGTCATCWGPPGLRGSAESEGWAAVALVPVAVPTAGDVVTELPASVALLRRGEPFVVEVWAQGGRIVEGVEEGLAAVYVDVAYDASRLTPEGVLASGGFGLFAHGQVEGAAGVVRAVGGCAPLGERSLGTEGTWVRVASVRMRSRQVGVAALAATASTGPYGVALLNHFGDLEGAQLTLGTASVEIYARALVPEPAIPEPYPAEAVPVPSQTGRNLEDGAP